MRHGPRIDTNEHKPQIGTDEHELTGAGGGESGILYRELSYRIVGLAMEAHRRRGYGFLEKVYENAMMVLFRQNSVPARQQAPVAVYFEQEAIGHYLADILVDEKVIVEVKSCEEIVGAHRAQVLNYLKATGFRLGIILNFGKTRLEFERLVL